MSQAKQSLCLVAIVLGLLTLPLVAHAETKKGSSSKSSSGSSESGQTVRRLKRDMATLNDDLAQTRQALTAWTTHIQEIQTALEDTQSRLLNLEKAISELNGKTVNTGLVSEENKTQVLELSRKNKSLTESLDQLRDQVDRLQREVIQNRAKAETAPLPSPAPEVRSK